MLSSLILVSKKNITYQISTRISSEKTKPTVTNFEPTMFYVANDRVILKRDNSMLVQKLFSSLCSNFALNL